MPLVQRMVPSSLPRRLAVLLLAAPVGAQSFVDDTSAVPQGPPANASSSENVDFADVDLDGDWDAVFADGGNDGNDQNRIWINQGGAQGGVLGTFVDRTAQQLPAVLDTSRDVEFVDVDADGDPDLYVSNTSSVAPQTNRWWINQGGLQGGRAGYFVDETAARWVGLDTPPTSIASSTLLPVGFVDWSCDCDFGDLDDDGDLDLVHSSYGGQFDGAVPTRIFLNDGSGAFREFNPSGFRLSGPTLSDGDPGLWCEGVQRADTTDASGAECDVASTALDIDVGDIDGDFDLDILHGARSEPIRMFANRLEGSPLAPALGGGQLGFRDVTGAVFPPGYATGVGHYEQEMGDLDGDGDLDILGLNWLVGSIEFDDVTLRNRGDGTFDQLTVVEGSGSDDSEGDFLDFDNDGDLDFYVASFFGQDRIYRNDKDGGATFSFTNRTSTLPPLGATGLDAEVCDVDGDGDYDVFVANDDFARNYYLRNTSEVPDTTPPYVPRVEQAPDRASGSAPTVVRAHVYDNTPYYLTWYDRVWLEVAVGGGAPFDVPMRSSGGQVFRGEIPGALTGLVTYRVLAEDGYGNRGESGLHAYLAGAELGTRSCSPAVPNSFGAPGEMLVSGSALVAADDLTLTARSLPQGPNIGYFLMGVGTNTFTPPGSAGPICVAPGLKRFLPPVEDTRELGGGFTRSVGTSGPVSGQIAPGSTWSFQAWHRDGMGPSNLTDAVSVTFQ